MSASGPVLTTLAKVLRLDEDQTAYLYERAGRPSARPAVRTRQKARPQIKRLVELTTDVPAMVQRRNFDILAWNPLAAALMVDFSQYADSDRNWVRLLFTEPGLRALYPEWEELARTTVSYLRMEAAKTPDDPRLATLVGELSVKDVQFRQWWAAQYVAIKRSGTRRYTHPIVGELTLEWETLTADSDPDQQVIFWTADPATPSFQALRRLAALVHGK